MQLKNEISQQTKDAMARYRERQKSEKSTEEFGGLTFIEQLTAKRGNCEAEGVPFLYRLDEDEKKIEFAKGRCGLWACQSCALDNARKWIARVIDGINNLEPDDWYFATVTAHRYHRGEKSLENLRSNWHKLRKRMARIVDKLFYVRVWEHHKDGSYHLHMITNAPVSTRWLKDNAAQCGLGYQAKIDKAINAGQAAGYMAKYMLKQSNEDTLHSYPVGARRIEVSRNWVNWFESDSDWHYAGTFESAKGMSLMRKGTGWKVHDLAIINEEKRRNEKFKRNDNE